MIAREAVVTFDRPDGFRVVRSLGRAVAEASRPPSLLRVLRQTFAMLMGSVASEVRGEAERARDECIAALLERADALGANGVVGLRFESVEPGDGSIVVRASGEAVVLEPERAEPAR